MYRYVRFLAVVALVTPCLLLAQLSPQPPANLHDRIVEAARSNSLLSPDLKPWHLKLDATFYDVSGKNPTTGTFETWHSGNDSRTVTSIGSATWTVIRSAGKTYMSQSGPNLSATADDLLNEVLSPGPSAADIEHATLDLHVESFGKLKLDCIMLALPIPHASSAPMGLFPTYCLDPGSTILRATYNFGSVTVLRNRIGQFQSKNVALDVSLMEGTVLRAQGKTSALATFTPTDEFTPAPDMKQIGTGAPRVAGGVMAGHILKKVDPIYPLTARQNHVSGTVVLAAVIGRDGRIHSLRPISAPDADLAMSAIAAVRQWTYTPYLLNGDPVEVYTTITVNYNLNPF